MIETVGKVYIKNEKNGSYQYMRIISYDGETYADIERGGAYSEYVVDQSAYIHKISTNGGGCLSLDDICRITQKVYEKILFKTRFATEAEFKTVYNDVELRVSSVRDGAYGAIDIGNIVNSHGVYLRCSVFAEGDAPKLSVLESSALSSNLSVCADKVLKSSYKFFYPCMGAVYCDLELFLLSPFWRWPLKGALKPFNGYFGTILELKRKYCVSRVHSPLRPHIKFAAVAEREVRPNGDLYRDAICGMDCERNNLFKLVAQRFGGRFADASLVRDLLALPYDSEVLKINSRCTEYLHALGERLAAHGVLTDEKFVDFLTPTEILRAYLGDKHCKQLKKASAARLGNAYFHKEPPTLFNSFSQAFEP